MHPHRSLAVITIAAAIAVSGCSQEEPPGWLEDLAVQEAQATSIPPTTAPTATTVPEAPGEEISALDLVKGTCLVDVPFLEGEPVEVTELRIVACREPHQAEIFDVVQLQQASDAPFPGAPLARQARNQCRDRFEAFVGIPWTSSELEFATIRPTAESWAEGDRAIVCTLFRPDGKDLEGSVRGAEL